MPYGERLPLHPNSKPITDMNIKAILLAAGSVVFPFAASALSLAEARRMARDNYPAIRQYRLIEQSNGYSISNASKAWLPQVSVSTGAYAFTDIIKANTQMERMGISTKNSVASASVTVRQNIYDGGQTAAQKLVTAAESDVQTRQLDVTMYDINKRVDNIYFGILVIDAQLRQNALLQQDLATGEETVRSMISHGIANEGDLETILVEKLKATQQRDAMTASRKAYLRMLGTFMGKTIEEGDTLETPVETAAVEKTGVNRPELSYYASRDALLDARRRQIDSRLRPTVTLFGAGLAHTNVSDMIKNGVAVGGVSVAWNIGALYTRKNDIRSLQAQKAINNVMRETFLFQTKLKNEEADGNIEALRKQIAGDEEIIRLRESLRNRNERKVRLGTESVNQLVSDINAVGMARAQKAQHEIMLLKEMYNQKNINNE